MITFILRYAYAPFMLVGANGVAAWLITSGASKPWLLAPLIGAIAVSFAVERAIPYEDAWNRDIDGDSLRDALHSFVNESLALVSVAAVPVLAVLIPGGAGWPNDWPFVVQLLFAVLVADFGVTTVHLASHKIGLLWRFHAVHHSVKRFYGFNGFMKHPLHQTLETSVGLAPLLLLGMPLDVASALAFCVAIQLLLQHSNADYRVGPLRSILALNEGHRFHHLKWAGVGDVNFGLFTLLWDHLFRTYSYDSTRVFSSDDLGMAAHPDYPSDYLPQIVQPFTRAGACELGEEPTAVDSRAADLAQERP